MAILNLQSSLKTVKQVLQSRIAKTVGIIRSPDHIELHGIVVCPKCKHQYDRQADLHLPFGTLNVTIICMECKTNFDINIPNGMEVTKIRPSSKENQ